jgi:ABC-type xylose transport system substrate-binding protein
MTDKGSLAIDLVCPEGHVAGQLIRNTEDQAIGIQVPDRAREEWPRGGDKMYTLLTCPGCNRRVYGATDAIQESATWLSEIESQGQDRYSLRYLEDGLT